MIKINNKTKIIIITVLITTLSILTSEFFLIKVGYKHYVTTSVSKHYDERTNYFKTANMDEELDGIVFLGDSITEGFDIESYFTATNVINRGIGGDTTNGVLERLQESVYDLSPSKVFLMIGTNDLDITNNTNKQIASNIESIILDIQENSPETEIYLESIYPTTKGNDDKSFYLITRKRPNTRINAINDELVALAAKHNVTYIDVNSALIDNKGDLTFDYTSDGLHLNSKGYNQVGEILAPYITK